MAACGLEGLCGESAGRRGTAERLVSAHSTVTARTTNLTAHMPPQRPAYPPENRRAQRFAAAGKPRQGFGGS